MKSYFFILTFSLAILSIVSCYHDEVGLIADAYDPDYPSDSGYYPKPNIPDIQFQPIEYERSHVEITSYAANLIQTNFQSLSTEELTILDSISIHLELSIGSSEIDNWILFGDSLVDSIHGEDVEFTKTSQKMDDLFSGDDWLKNYLIIIKPTVFESFEVGTLVQGDSLLSLAYIDTTDSDCANVWYKWGMSQYEAYLKVYDSKKKVTDSVYQIRSVELFDYKQALTDSIHQDYQYHINHAINYWVSFKTRLRKIENSDPSLYSSLSAFNNTLLASNYFRIKNLRESTIEQLGIEYEKRAEDLEFKYLNLVHTLQVNFNKVAVKVNDTLLEHINEC